MKQFIIITFISTVFSLSLGAYKVTVENNTDKVISGVEAKSYSAVFKKEEGKVKSLGNLRSGESETHNFGLSNTAFVRWTQNGVLYEIDTKNIVKNIVVHIFDNGRFAINPAKVGKAKGST